MLDPSQETGSDCKTALCLPLSWQSLLEPELVLHTWRASRKLSTRGRCHLISTRFLVSASYYIISTTDVFLPSPSAISQTPAVSSRLLLPPSPPPHDTIVHGPFHSPAIVIAAPHPRSGASCNHCAPTPARPAPTIDGDCSSLPMNC